MTTREQVRAARALLGWDEIDLANAAQVPLPLIRKLDEEPGLLKTQGTLEDAIVNAFLTAGVSLFDGNYSSLGGPGVRFTRPTSAPLDVDEGEMIQYREFFENDAPPGAGG